MPPGKATDQIGGYKLVSRLGAGGTGTVFKAYQEKLGRTVALKVLHPGYGRNQALVKRFKREIQTSAALNHPHIVKVFDAGQEGDHHYFSMEFIEGAPLREQLRGGKKLAIKDALKIALQMCDALNYFHQRGMIHRDIKPENIMIDAQGDVKLMDFGIVKVQDSTVITQEGSTLGTPRYMSPEMVMGEAQDLRSDLFQLGVVLYEMLTGKCPFDGPTISAIATMITDQAPPAPSLLTEMMPPAVEAVVFKALEKEPVNRYKDADEMAAALKQAELASMPGKGRGKQERALPQRVATFKMNADQVISPDDSGNTVIEMPKDLSQVPKFLEKSFRSAKTSLAEPEVRNNLALVAAAFITGLAIIWLWVNQRGPSMVGTLNVVEGLAGVQAAWKTSRPGLTEVEITDSSGQSRRFRNSTEPSVTEHSIVIKQLHRGGEYTVRVVHPDNSRSDPVKVTLPTAEKLLENEPQLAVKEPGTVELSLRTNAPALAHVACVRGQTPASLKLSNGYAREHKLVLSGIGADEEIHDMRLVVEGVDERVEEPLPPVMGGARLAQAIRQKIGGMKLADFEQIASRLDKMMRQKKKLDEAALAAAHKKANEEGKSAARSWLKEKQLDGLLATLPMLASWAFSPATDLDSQIEAYKALLRLEDLDYLTYELTRLPLLDTPVNTFYRSFVQVDHVTDPGHATQIVDNMQKDAVISYMGNRYRHENENTFVTFENGYYYQGKMEGVDLSSVSTKYRGSSTHDFVVEPADLTAADRVRFVFQIANMRTDVYLEVVLNEKLAVRVRPDPTKLHEYDMQSLFMQSDTIEQRSSFVAITIPAKLLVAGKNHLSITCDTVPGIPPVLGASLLRVWFRVEPKAS